MASATPPETASTKAITVIFNVVQREATKAGISLQEAMTVCVERNWITFKSDWDWKSSAKPQSQNLGTWK